MTTFQKIIKYLAIALAIFIIVNIVSAILFGFYSISYIFGLNRGEDREYKEESIVREFEYSEVDILDVTIEVDFSNLVIKKGESFKVETDSNYIKCNQNGGEIRITEENHSWLSRRNDIGDVTVYMPDIEFKEVKISTGAGKIKIEEIDAMRLSLEIGAGETEIGTLNVTDKADIEGGAGKVTISSGTINNLNLDMGVGKLELNAKLTGNIDIDAGVGELDIKIKDKKDNYKIKTSKGIGSITIDGKSVSDDAIYGEGENYIKIDGGIGSIKVNFE